MLGKFPFWEKSQNIPKKEIEIEVTAQIEKFYELTGYYPYRIDGHQHIHVIPHVLEVIADVAQRYGILIIRVPVDHTVEKGISP
jgi:chitin disaccharide deacetylase